MLDSNIFRAYDIRGIVHKTITEETMKQIGQMLGTIVLEKNNDTMLVARDGRLSGPLLSRGLSEGIMAAGCNVIDIGVVATPLLYFATKVLNCKNGVMVTGSHNPPNYNGLKMIINETSLTAVEIKQIYNRIIQNDFKKGSGDYSTFDVDELYLKNIITKIDLQKRLHIVIDAGNGVAGNIAPKIFRALGCDVTELFCEIDGTFPNHHPDPSQPENLQKLIQSVKEKKADIGFAFDGDGDRLGVITDQGEVIYPDRLLMLFAKYILNVKPNTKIIYDVKCTHHLDPFIRAHEGEPLMWKTGHSLIKAKLLEEQAVLAGEMSGHFFFNDRWYGFDDALYAAARLAEILSQTNETASMIFSKIPNSVNTPELKVFIEEEEKFELMTRLINQASFSNAKEVVSIDGLRINFNDGWGLVRPSNTTPYLILRFEAINETILANIQSLFREWMLSVKPDLILPF